VKYASRLLSVSLLLCLTLVSCDQPTTNPAVPLQADVAVFFFSDRASFLAQFPDLAMEDFEAGLVRTPPGVMTCPGPLDATSDNACFHPGDIAAGVQFNADHFEAGEEIVMVDAGFFGAPSKSILANVFTDAFLIDFPGGVTAVGMDLVAYLDDDICQIDVSGQSGLILSTTAPCTNAGAFWGLSSSEPITHIRIYAPSGQSEGVDNISFGQAVRFLPPIANAGGPYTGNEGAAVVFDGSASATNPAGGALTYAWDFGDGATASGATASHTYADNAANNGNYTVTLTVTAVDGGLTNSATTTATIANVAPVVSALADANLGLGETYAADGSFTDPGADTWTATVNYGDGSEDQPLALTGTTFHLSHAYPAGQAGPFTVRVTVRDDDGGAGTAEATVTVEVNRAPVANAGPAASGAEGSAVAFDGSHSSDPDGNPLTYSWDFGDGSSGSGPTPSHTYADNGTYAVKLTVSDGSLSAEATTSAVISNVAPAVSALADATLHLGETYAADGSFTDPGADTWTAMVNYGDGSGDQALALTGMTFHLSHAYPAGQAGPFTVQVTVRDDDGGVGTAEARVTAEINRAPVANAGPAASGFEGSLVSFDGSHSEDPDGTPLTYSWDFGDGSSATGPTPMHRYADNGTYVVKLTVSDGMLSGEATTSAVIANVAPSVGLITAPIDPLEVGTLVTATAPFFDPGTLDTHTGVIEWGDGSTSSAAIDEANGSGSASGSHAYAAAGVYTLTLTVTDKDGGSGRSVFQFVVVFNPLGGFVTGGGWIFSPPGAYPTAPNLTGKATFGFVSKYPKNAITPEGSMEFDFHIGSLRFRSTSYDWLVVSTSKVRFKGSGTINGAGDFAFLVSAVDGDVTGGDPDTFRMKIWDKSTGVVIYDSEMGSGDGAPASTVLGRGSIVIHN